MPAAARPILRALDRSARQPRLQRAPWICSNCRQARREFTTTTPNRSTSSSENNNAKPPTHFTLFPQTFPTGPNYTPNLKTLRTEFLRLQTRTHPDRAPSNLKSQYESLSATLNTAYKTLLDPLTRAQYILSQNGIDVEDEASKLGDEDAGLLMEVMEAREAVDEVEAEEELVALREENDQRIESSVRVLEDAFGAQDLHKAAREAVRLRYWMNIEESIQGWEKGSGGGILHH